MSAPFEVNALSKPSLTFDGIVGVIRDVASDFKDKRQGSNRQYTMEDFVLSAFSVFYLQCPSFLCYQQEMENAHSNNNARTLFGIEKIPTDNHIRSQLDEEKPAALFPAFEAVFDALEARGFLANFRSAHRGGDLLIAFDGVEYHRSQKVRCSECKVTEHGNGQTYYSHGMVTAVLVKSGCSFVVDLPPEFIVPQDGYTKQDCELAASKRWLKAHTDRYKPYGITILGDDLYSHQPFCEDVLQAQAHFIFTCKTSSHKTLYEYVEGLKETGLIEQLEVKRWTGKRHETDHYFYTHKVPLRDGKDGLLVNWCELTTTDKEGNVLFHNAYVSDIAINKDTVAGIVEDGRTRWKTENENNNTLKRQGYHLEHNFGHGEKNLSNVLVTLNLLSFLLHTVLAMVSDCYQKIRKALGARRKFFEHLRTLLHYILFPSWDEMMGFMMEKLELPYNSS